MATRSKRTPWSGAKRRLWFGVYRHRIRTGREYCRACRVSGTDLNFDHLIARANGGPSNFDNATILCVDCNLLKGGQSWDRLGLISLEEEERRAPPHRRWAEIAQAELRAYDPHDRCPTCGQWEQVNTGGIVYPHTGATGRCPGGHKAAS